MSKTRSVWCENAHSALRTMRMWMRERAGTGCENQSYRHAAFYCATEDAHARVISRPTGTPWLRAGPTLDSRRRTTATRWRGEVAIAGPQGEAAYAPACVMTGVPAV